MKVTALQLLAGPTTEFHHSHSNLAQLLHASPIAGPGICFAISSFKAQVNIICEQTTIGMGEPMMLVSPVTTVSSKESIEALQQLHSHLTVF
jgi:hypothetical protein